jgi:hypothetical protein
MLPSLSDAVTSAIPRADQRAKPVRPFVRRERGLDRQLVVETHHVGSVWQLARP